MLNKKPRFNNNPPFLSENFQILKTCLIITPPLSTKNISGNSYIFSCFSLGRSLTTFLCPKAPEIIIPDVPPIPTNPHLFNNFVKYQLELVTVSSFYILSKVITVRTPVSVGRTFKSGKDMTYWYMIYRLVSDISNIYYTVVYFRNS